jgi:alpha-galactosidase
MMGLGRRVIEATGSPTSLIGSTNRREVLEGADFVVLTFSRDNARLRGLDCAVADKYGIHMCSGDTVGPGGIFRSLREVPVALDVARDVAELAPDAWLVNLVNPTAVLGIALMRYVSGVRSFALCDGHHEPHHSLRLLRDVGIVPDETRELPPDASSKLDVAIAGVNHFTWMLRFSYDGEDMMPQYCSVIARRAAEESGDAHSKRRYNHRYELDLMEVFGAYPDCIAHTKEYVPFYQGHGVTPVEPASLTVFDAEMRQREMDARMRENGAYAAGEKDIRELLDAKPNDHASDVIESMWGSLGQPFYINTLNRGAVSNLADDAFLELRCDVDMEGPKTQPVGELPRGILGLTQRLLDSHELTAEAAATFDRALVLRALATDPLTTNLADARRIMEKLFEAEREWLDDRWYA